jgi:hypothetical protein
MSDSAIASGIRYGEIPAGVSQVVAAKPLIAGDPYFLRIWWLREVAVGTGQYEWFDVDDVFFRATEDAPAQNSIGK